MTIILNIFFEDEDFIIINKESGVLVHRGYANDDVTYVDLIRDYGFFPYPLHRLDRQTSGLLIFAKTKKVASKMRGLFEEKKITKTYTALVRGEIPEYGNIDHPIPKAEKAERVLAVSNYTRIAIAEIQPRHLSLVSVSPITGRFHQVRRHMKHIHHPIIGDANYGKGALNREIRARYGLARLALHARALTFEWNGHLRFFEIEFPNSLALPFRKMGLEKECDFRSISR